MPAPALIYRTTDLSQWGIGKGSNLDADEVDQNFWDLAEALGELIDNPAEGVSITNVTASGSALTVHLSDGSTRGPFILPIATLSYQGLWEPETSYTDMDLFSVEGYGLFISLQDHTSAEEFDPDAEAGGNPLYELIVPVMSPSPGWVEIEPDTDGNIQMDFEISDKFIATIDASTEIYVPINADGTAPTFALRLRISESTATSSIVVTFAEGFLGEAPIVLTDPGDETVMTGIIMDQSETDGDTAIINSVKSIPAV